MKRTIPLFLSALMSFSACACQGEVVPAEEQPENLHTSICRMAMILRKSMMSSICCMAGPAWHKSISWVGAETERLRSCTCSTT